MRRVFLLSSLLFLLIGSQASAQTVSFASLFDEMINRDNLARFPSPDYTCSQASSYDRGTVAPDKPGWFANMDRSHFVRTEEQGRPHGIRADGRRWSGSDRSVLGHLARSGWRTVFQWHPAVLSGRQSRAGD